MKKLVFSTLFFILLLSSAMAQLTGQIPALADTTWKLEGNDITPIPIKADRSGYFKIPVSSLKRGIYSLGSVGSIYIEPSYNLSILAKKGQYKFKGNGAVENQVLQTMNNKLNRFLGNPGYDVWHQFLLTEPVLFTPMLDEYIKKINTAAGGSKNIFFKEFIRQEVEFDKRYCLMAYSRFYGLDSNRMQALRKILATPIIERKESYRADLAAAYQAQFSKKLTNTEKDSLNNFIYNDWDMNNEIMYLNSKYYKSMIGYKIDYLAYAEVQRKLRDSIKNDEIVKLSIVKPLISNNYIKEALNFRYTNAAIKKSKFPSDITDIYESFIGDSKNEKHKDEIRKTFRNLSSTTANATAPDFNYTNPYGQLVSLKSLRGKYVYVDVWA
ncbi:MAG: hypothetical protein EOO90_27060, partial [Pedobacter sp.]